jgi:hypothetical protein
MLRFAWALALMVGMAGAAPAAEVDVEPPAARSGRGEPFTGTPRTSSGDPLRRPSPPAVRPYVERRPPPPVYRPPPPVYHAPPPVYYPPPPRRYYSERPVFWPAPLPRYRVGWTCETRSLSCELDEPEPLGSDCFCRNAFGKKRPGEVVP